MIRDCELSVEEAPIVVRSQSSVTFNGVRFRNNINHRGSTAISANQASSLIIQDSSFRRNGGRVGTVINARRDCNVTIIRSEFEQNYGRNSSLVFMNAQYLRISDSRIANNTAQRQAGGAIFIQVLHAFKTLSLKL